MIVAEKIDEIRKFCSDAKRERKTIGFVPTMGYLHKGHTSLMEIARPKCDILVVSIFVNPTQFGPNEDFERYPRNKERDLKICEEVGVDAVFMPNVKEMYPDGYSTYVNVEGDLTRYLCGASRPGHFRGVSTIVTKLFNIITPDFAVFGEKDAQQLAVVRQLVRDLNFPIEIVSAPIVRDTDGLAMSSRNEYLTPREREIAPAIYKSLLIAKELVEEGERNSDVIISAIRDYLEEAGEFKIDYVQVVNPQTMEPIHQISNKALIAVAAFLGKTRLIDNIMVET